MNKKLSKVVLECIFSIVLLFIPFIFANYFLTNYYLENGRALWDYDVLVIIALEWLSVFIVSLVIRKKNQNIVLENPEQSKKVFRISSVLFALLGLFVLLDGYTDIYSRISHKLGVFAEWPLALAVTWEQYFNGMFFLTFLMSVVICFFNKKYFTKNKNV